MFDKILNVSLTLIAYVGVGATISWFFWSYRKRELIGGFFGGTAVAFLGAVIIDFSIGEYLQKAIEFLMTPGFVKLNFISALAGAYLLVYILNKINNDRIRRDY